MAEMMVEPAESWWWEPNLTWLLDNRPELMRELWEKDREKILDLVAEKVKLAHRLESMLDHLPADVKTEMIQEELFHQEESPEEELPDQLLDKIYDWATDQETLESLDPLEVEIPDEIMIRSLKKTYRDYPEVQRAETMEEVTAAIVKVQETRATTE